MHFEGICGLKQELNYPFYFVQILSYTRIQKYLYDAL